MLMLMTSEISIYHIGVDLESVETVEPIPHKAAATAEFSLLLQLDTFPYPGISPAQFQCLFVQCQNCALYMTRGGFRHHGCIVN